LLTKNVLVTDHDVMGKFRCASGFILVSEAEPRELGQSCMVHMIGKMLSSIPIFFFYQNRTSGMT